MTQDRVMLLIDADNVSIDVMEQALQLLHKQHGAVHVRRAYCTAESAVKHQTAFKRMGIKPMVNLAAGKNSTDIAMAVDAIDLVLAERPDVVAIASSDSDFAPLVQRLREKGCEVRGIGQAGKTGDETQGVYDDFTVLEHRKSAEAPASRPRAARKTAAAKKTPAAKKVAAPAVAEAAPVKAATKKVAAKKVAAKKTPAARKTKAAATASADAASDADAVFADILAGDVLDAAPAQPPARKAPARKSAARKTAAATQAPAAAPEPSPPPAPTPAGRSTPRATLADVLACLPELLSGRSLRLGTAARRLRDAQLLGESGKSTKLFANWPDRFELLPADHPSEVRLRGT